MKKPFITLKFSQFEKTHKTMYSSILQQLKWLIVTVQQIRNTNTKTFTFSNLFSRSAAYFAYMFTYKLEKTRLFTYRLYIKLRQRAMTCKWMIKKRVEGKALKKKIVSSKSVMFEKRVVLRRTSFLTGLHDTPLYWFLSPKAN